jgi:hypothetical protein
MSSSSSGNVITSRPRVSRGAHGAAPPAAVGPDTRIVKMPMNTLQATTKMHGFRRSDIHWERRSQSPGALRGKQVAMIGGTNRIGRALARLFAAKEEEVVVVGRTFRDHGVERLRFIAADLSQMK